MPVRKDIVVKVGALVTHATLVEGDAFVRRVHDAVRADSVGALRSYSSHHRRVRGIPIGTMYANITGPSRPRRRFGCEVTLATA